MSSQANAQVDAVIVGAGFAGLYQLYRLRGLGLTTRVFEAGDGVGGTWYWNRYPGARCDVESIYYSYSFSEEPEQEWNWTERYAAQPEILRYIEYVAKKFDLAKDITLSTRVTAAHYREDEGLWEVRTDTGEQVVARFLIMATGCLSVAKSPEIDGAEDFKGPIYHTSHWPHEGVDFTGQKVGVIGTGSSGVQSIPMIARQARSLTVFQRTPTYCFPALNKPLDEQVLAEAKARYRDIRRLQHESTGGVPLEFATKTVYEVSDEERDRAYQAAWESGDIFKLVTAFKDAVVDETANEYASDFVRRRIADVVRSPDVAEALSPRTYGVGTKRPCLDTGYYDTYNRDNVTLVNLRKEPLDRITSAGIRTAERDFEFDAIVFATGFDAMTGALKAIDIRGRGGALLSDAWAGGPQTLLGMSVAGFPNMFIVAGPLSPSILTNMIVSIEQSVDWITDCIQYLREKGIGTIEATEEAQDQWVRHVAKVASYTLYPKTDSWYMGANVPGKPRVFLAYVGGLVAYRAQCNEVAAEDYRGFRLGQAAGVSSQPRPEPVG
jgi:cyclohexanone monooxygenase